MQKTQDIQQSSNDEVDPPAWLEPGEFIRIRAVGDSAPDDAIYDVVEYDGETATIANTETGDKITIQARRFHIWSGVDAFY